MSNHLKDLKTGRIIRALLPQIPSLYPSAWFRDLKRINPQECLLPKIPGFHPQNNTKRLVIIHTGRPRFGGVIIPPVELLSLNKYAILKSNEGGAEG